MNAADQLPVLQVDGLSLEFRTRGRTAEVLSGVSFDLRPGETLCLVGESGCGKSMTALAIMRLIPPLARIGAGHVRLRGADLASYGDEAMRRVRGNDISMIFQEPMTALNPVYTVGDQIAEPLRQHQGLGKTEARERAIGMLRSVGIPLPERRVDDYPHQLSGGMRQRVMIAIALACDPEVLIADEPTTALDVTVQAQIFDLLREQQARRGTAVLMITHDMGAVSEMADRVAVMYGGRVVEQGDVGQILAQPRHPYTQGLIACLPELDRTPSAHRPDLPEIPGVVPSVWERGEGCPFQDRCNRALARCRNEFPPMAAVGDGHAVACWLYPEAA
ncbi:Oligopeptide transport ATP-binding protein OppD [Achromobacter deleyi]|uniref:Oligopeptide transport ATP-binding protein OppD n=1 Tax=Achromobacter deleyi TaxID=1353891 RepID=A0A6S7AT62_9BURK|nr:ABC transporter ATP-binding protein [Achromobacter deleyi]CAB3733754.1 Oligopeptide transport ATP-binding protein OppD [Achromobacter deleyi]CAB3908377.1 Oligopeptide transport ATP-binding protein OppD [Achromobacter deleyi]CAB3909768.1 Oligopeptide transport ATP-binding protein OppD [Achromobacter deleyi]